MLLAQIAASLIVLRRFRSSFSANPFAAVVGKSKVFLVHRMVCKLGLRWLYFDWCSFCDEKIFFGCFAGFSCKFYFLGFRCKSVCLAFCR